MENVERIRKAAAEGDLLRIEFYPDGSGAAFYIRYKNECYNRMEDQMLSLRIDEAVQVVAGFRFIQHHLKTCY